MHRYVVEFLGTMFLMCVILLTGNYLAIGAALAIIVLLGGNTSGGAFNPAVTIGMVMGKQLPISDLFPYIAAEVMGAVMAMEFVKLIRGKV